MELEREVGSEEGKVRRLCYFNVMAWVSQVEGTEGGVGGGGRKEGRRMVEDEGGRL